MSSSKNESSFSFLLCSLDYLGLVKIHSLVRVLEIFLLAPKYWFSSTLSSVSQPKGVKGESSPSTARLYLPINVMPFPRLISLWSPITKDCYCPCFPYKETFKTSAEIQTLPGMDARHLNRPVMVKSTPKARLFLKENCIVTWWLTQILIWKSEKSYSH